MGSRVNKLLRLETALFLFTFGGSPFPPCTFELTAPHVEESPAYRRYQRVVDLLFPRAPSPGMMGDYYIVLRYLPAFDAETQIIIVKQRHKTFLIRHYYLPKGSKSIAVQVADEIERVGTQSPRELADRIRVEVRDVSLPPATIAELLARFQKLRISPQLDTRIMIDPTWYELWFRTTSSGSELHFLYGDIDYGQDQKAHPLVHWMNQVREAVESSEQRQSE